MAKFRFLSYYLFVEHMNKRKWFSATFSYWHYGFMCNSHLPSVTASKIHMLILAASGISSISYMLFSHLLVLVIYFTVNAM